MGNPVVVLRRADKADQDVVKYLERLLEDAKRGDLKAVLLLSDYGNENDWYQVGVMNIGTALLAIERWKFQALHQNEH